MQTVWEFDHSIECNAPREFCWSYWADIADCDDPIARVLLGGPFEGGSQFTTELSEQTLVSVTRYVHVGLAATIEIDLPNALFSSHWSFDDLGGMRTRISQRLVLSGEGAAAFLDQATVMGETAPEALKKLIAAMERALATSLLRIFKPSHSLNEVAIQAT